MKNKKAFTIIEILIVVAIIGILSSVVLVATSNSRAKARDAQRKSDVAQIAKAFAVYGSSTNNYDIPGTGNGSTGRGWFNYEGGSYTKSIAHGLEEAGLFSTAPRDPGLTSNNQTPQYMKYNCTNGGVAIYAKLENPTQSDTDNLAAIEAAGCSSYPRTTYGHNFAVRSY